MKRERLDQKEFYIRLSEALGESSGDIWAETVEKSILSETGPGKIPAESVRRLLKIPSERL